MIYMLGLGSQINCLKLMKMGRRNKKAVRTCV